jgi:uncharacterized protein (DUF305 family)
MKKEMLFAAAGIIAGGIIGYAAALQTGGSDMHAAMGNMTAGLENKQGDEFEHAFLMDMIVHHEGAVDMAQMVLDRSQRPELRKLAEDIIAAQAREIEQMRQWMNTWFNH